jgi:hypothetical protein
MKQFMSSNDIDWNDVIKKEARGIDDADFGKIHNIQGNYVLVKRGIINKEQFYIPKDQAESYDVTILSFRISESDLKTRYKDESFMNAESGSIENDMNKLEEEIDSKEE